VTVVQRKRSATVTKRPAISADVAKESGRSTRIVLRSKKTDTTTEKAPKPILAKKCGRPHEMITR
jgi:hypothetical protein